MVAGGDGVVVVPRKHVEEVAKPTVQFFNDIGLEWKKMKKGLKPAVKRSASLVGLAVCIFLYNYRVILLFLVESFEICEHPF